MEEAKSRGILRTMKAFKISIRYLGCQTFVTGNRLLHFSCARSDGAIQEISITVLSELFSGPDAMAIQECPAICYETLKEYALEIAETLPSSITLTSADIDQHRKPERGSRLKPKHGARPAGAIR